MDDTTRYLAYIRDQNSNTRKKNCGNVKDKWKDKYFSFNQSINAKVSNGHCNSILFKSNWTPPTENDDQLITKFPRAIINSEQISDT